MSARSSEWPEVRKAHLEVQPSCQACGTSDHLQVHHIRPFHLRPELELEPGNLITLCEKPGHDCHFTWGHYHDWYSWNSDVVADAAAYLAKQKARP